MTGRQRAEDNPKPRIVVRTRRSGGDTALDWWLLKLKADASSDAAEGSRQLAAVCQLARHLSEFAGDGSRRGLSNRRQFETSRTESRRCDRRTWQDAVKSSGGVILSELTIPPFVKWS